MKQARETTLTVEGMTCPSCIRHVDHALKDLEGVSHVDVNLRGGTVRVRHDEDAASLADLVRALEEAGYPARAPAP